MEKGTSNKWFIVCLLVVIIPIQTFADCPFTVTVADLHHCGNGIASINASASTTGITWNWAFSEFGTPISTPGEVSGITYTVSNSGATLNIDGMDGPGGLSDPSVIWVQATKSGCSVWKSIQIIYSSPSVNAGADQVICGTASPITLTGTPSGGTWSGTGVSGSTFTPNTTYAGTTKTLTYSYTDTYGCSNSDTRIVTIEGIPNQPQLEACKTTGAVLLESFSGTATGSWSGNNVYGSTFLPLTASEYTTINFNYTTTANGCTGTASQVIHSYSHTAAAGPTISNPSANYNCGSGTFNLAATGFSAGNYLWYDNQMHPILQSNGSLYTSSSYTTPSLTSSKTYYVQGIDGQDCGTQMTEVSASVVPLPTTPTMIDGSNCSDGNAVISISSPNSSYTYEWVDSNDVPIQTNSSETIGYILTNNTLSIQDIPGTSNFQVKVRAVNSTYSQCKSAYATGYAVFREPPTASVGTNVPSIVCTSTPAITLSGGTPTGGTWKVNGVETTTFDPPILGAGNQTVTYIYTDQYGCKGADAKQVTVNSITAPVAQTFRTVHGTTITISPTDPGTNKTFNWYTAPSTGTAFSSTDTWTTGEITSTTRYYISIKDETVPACESTSRAEIIVYPNYLPVVNAGSDKTLVVPARNTVLNASFSDPDGTISSYYWAKVSGPDVSIGDANVASLPLNQLANGTYVFRFTATDNYDFVNNDDVTVLVVYPPNNYNRVVTEIINVASVTDSSTIATLDEYEKSKTIEYVDGLGRPRQQVQWRGSSNKKDVVQPLVYDEFGREPVKYLPYTSTSNTGIFNEDAIVSIYPNSKQSKFYDGSSNLIASDTVPYARTVFEPSPLNRVIEQGAPGASWQPGTNNTIKTRYLTNQSNEVLLFTYTSNSLSGTVSWYAPNMLSCIKTIDEHQNDVLQYVDKLGRTICKKVKVSTGVYASTYYVYDNLGNLVVVLPPEAIQTILSENGN